jgi:hypothetical protein
MAKRKSGGTQFESQRLIDSLEAQAQLCDRIARRCSTELESFRYLKLAKECRAAAGLEKTRIASTFLADFPEIVAF